MSLLLWPVVVVLFLVWSFAAWLLYSLSDWAAAIVSSAMGGILSPELGSWAQWLSTSLGDILQVLVVVTWAVLGLAILSAPAWIGRLVRRNERRPFLSGVRPSGGHDWRERRGRDGDDCGHDRRDDWKRGKRDWRGDLEDLRHLAYGFGKKYGSKKKWKKKWGD